jgi:DNA-binding CsgD family transcriptional regulator
MSVGIDQRQLSSKWNRDAQFRCDGIFRATLDLLRVGIVIVDADSYILHTNYTAAKMLSLGEPISSCHGHLRAACTMTSMALTEAASQIAQKKANAHMPGVAVPLPRRDGRAAVAHVRPLYFGDPLVGRQSGTAAAIFITDPAAEHTPPPLDVLMAIFKLTWSEARVFEQIVSGRNRKVAAAVLGIADSTVKTHLENVFAKTGTSDQLGLCRLAAKLSWPVG